jgi:hypothetical protein
MCESDISLTQQTVPGTIPTLIPVAMMMMMIIIIIIIILMFSFK